jgi:hypothetical protein
MIKAKKYSLKKGNPLNTFLDLLETDSFEYLQFCLVQFYLQREQFIYPQVIKTARYKRFAWQLIKELNTETWMLMCPNLLIMYLRPNMLQEFEMFNQESNFCFHVYNTPDFLIAFCVSHLIQDTEQSESESDSIEQNVLDNTEQSELESLDSTEQCEYIKDTDTLQFMYTQNCNPNYLVLNQALTPFVILNQSYKSKSDLIPDTFSFYSAVGKGVAKPFIVEFIRLVTQLKHCYKTLPYHYLLM